MKKCKHTWQTALPNVSEMPEDKKMDLLAVLMVRRHLSNLLYCPICCRTGYSVYGRKIKLYTTNYFLDEANKERLRLGLSLLNVEQSVQECDATKAK